MILGEAITAANDPYYKVGPWLYASFGRERRGIPLGGAHS